MDKQIWESDFRRLAEAVAPYVEQYQGFKYVGDDCPAELSGMYARIIQVGYANGFI